MLILKLCYNGEKLMNRILLSIMIILITIGLTYFSFTYLTSNFYLNRDSNEISDYAILDKPSVMENNVPVNSVYGKING